MEGGGTILVLVIYHHGARRQEGLEAAQVVVVDVGLEGPVVQRDHLIGLCRGGRVKGKTD